MVSLRLGGQTCGNLAEGAAREWLVADGLGGYAMGTASGLRTRRYHGLLVVTGGGPSRRDLALASLDPVLVAGDTRVRLAVHAWEGGAIDPDGHRHLASFAIEDGLPSWRWQACGVVVERTLAMLRGRAVVGVVHRIVSAPGPVRLEVAALGTRRDAHGERFAEGAAPIETVDGGAIFDHAWRVRGPGFAVGGEWYRGARLPEETARGLGDHEDLCHLGTFEKTLAEGEAIEIEAWAGDLADAPPPAQAIVDAAHRRAQGLTAGAADEIDAVLRLAADKHVVQGPTVVAGYPWFGDWSRDTLTSYEGLFLETGREDEGRALLSRLLASVDGGMLPNTADTGTLEYNTIDAAPWLLHAIERHVTRTGDLDLAAEGVPVLQAVVAAHLTGTRHGIHADTDGLVTGGESGLALTWMDARVAGAAVTPRAGKPVEVNALWVSGLDGLVALGARVGKKLPDVEALAAKARASFADRFVKGGAVLDVVDGPRGDDASVRPNQLLAVSLPQAPLRDHPVAPQVVDTCRRRLLTPLGLRSLDPADPAYRGRHRGGPEARDRAYHQGTVWPWLVGPYVDAMLATGRASPSLDALVALVAHLGEYGLGSVSETADGDAPHGATGCPFQAWSVAELLRARRRLTER